jgi:hypothetical protein
MKKGTDFQGWFNERISKMNKIHIKKMVSSLNGFHQRIWKKSVDENSFINFQQFKKIERFCSLNGFCLRTKFKNKTQCHLEHFEKYNRFPQVCYMNRFA